MKDFLLKKHELFFIRYITCNNSFEKFIFLLQSLVFSINTKNNLKDIKIAIANFYNNNTVVDLIIKNRIEQNLQKGEYLLSIFKKENTIVETIQSERNIYDIFQDYLDFFKESRLDIRYIDELELEILSKNRKIGLINLEKRDLNVVIISYLIF
jgi:hypothetical protein